MSPAKVRKTCKAPGCEKPERGEHGYCKMHIQRIRRAGKIEGKRVLDLATGTAPCRLCGVVFRPSQRLIDQKQYVCRPCELERHRRDNKRYRAENVAKLKESMRQRYKDPERKRRRKELENPLKQWARRSLQLAVKSGWVKRPDACQGCGLPCKPQGHHHDYTKALDVEWLCPECHGKRHRIQVAATEPTPPTGEAPTEGHMPGCGCNECFSREMVAELSARPKPTGFPTGKETPETTPKGPDIYRAGKSIKDTVKDTDANGVLEDRCHPASGRLLSASPVIRPTDAARCECDACLGFASGECTRPSRRTKKGQAGA